MLKRLNCQVTVVNNGREAVSAVASQHFDGVFMDVQMPEMDGLAATAAIRVMNPQASRHLPIIALTADASAEQRQRCREAGMDDFLSKPIQLDDLRRLVERWS
ncbi:MAG: response regulator [Planctomycetota bacterium]|nr:MAG: response regulator [Planctomycetota bacterium]